MAQATQLGTEPVLSAHLASSSRSLCLSCSALRTRLLCSCASPRSALALSSSTTVSKATFSLGTREEVRVAPGPTWTHSVCAQEGGQRDVVDTGPWRLQQVEGLLEAQAGSGLGSGLGQKGAQGTGA